MSNVETVPPKEELAARMKAKLQEYPKVVPEPTAKNIVGILDRIIADPDVSLNDHETSLIRFGATALNMGTPNPVRDASDALNLARAVEEKSHAEAVRQTQATSDTVQLG